VTTVLGDKLDKTWLIEWKRRVGAREAKKVSGVATRRGSAIHGICERYVANEEDYLKGVMPIHQSMFSSIKTILDRYVDDIYGIEIPLYSLTLKTAGRTDLVAKYNGVPTIIDYKTSKKVKTESQILSYFLQSTVYSMMFERAYHIPIPQIAIIIAVDDEPQPLVFVKPRGIYVKKVLDVFVGD
jgi:genome maintenance exonuclease 1